MRNPFDAGDQLISIADERHRERIISEAEEARLLAACCHPQRLHLRPIIICALYTGMRQGEILKLRWSDVDLATRKITVQSMNTKTLRARQIEMPPIL
jgi:integrase